MIERIRYGGVNNPYNYSEFVCDTVVDLADLPTTVSVDKYKKFDTCSIGSKATVISDRTTYILNSNNQWIMLNDYKNSGVSIVVDETLTESGQAADSKVVGDKFLLLENWQTTQNKYINDMNIKVSSIESNSVGQKTADGGEIFNNYENNVATTNSHAEGYGTKALGNRSHAEGSGSTASGAGSHAEGYNTKATSDYTHAEGYNTTASGDYSHAEGIATTASGNYSHAEGNRTTASESQSHAEGYNTKASGNSSHAEGYYTKATERYTHAEGEYTTASGASSHAEGYNTKASSNYQHVQGKFNIENTDSKYAFIIGNGEDNNNRSNAIAIDWNGLIYLNNSDAGIDLSEISGNVTKLINDSSRHVHTNMQALMEITDADITALHSTFPQKIYEIEQSLSDYATKEEVAQAIEYAHTHQNKTTLNKITAAKFESWETAVQQIGDIQTVLESIVEVSE